MSAVLWHNEHRINVISQQGQKLLNYSANNIILHTSTTNNNFEKKNLSDMHHRTTYMQSNFQQNRASRSVKTVHTNLLAKQRKLHKFASCNSNFEKSRLSYMHYPISHIQANFGINRSIRYQVTAKRNYLHIRTNDRWTDGQTDGRTDGQTRRTTTIGFF